MVSHIFQSSSKLELVLISKLELDTKTNHTSIGLYSIKDVIYTYIFQRTRLFFCLPMRAFKNVRKGYGMGKLGLRK